MDTFASLDESSPSTANLPTPSVHCVPEVLDVFVDTTEAAPSLAPSGRPIDPHSGESRNLPGEAPPFFEIETPTSRRGRPRGSTNAARALEKLLAGQPPATTPARGAEKRTRSEICKAAAKAKHASRRHAHATPAPRQEFSGSGLEPCEAVVPWSAVSTSSLTSHSVFEDADLQKRIALWQPSQPQKHQPSCKTEAGILQSGLTLMSKAQLAKKLKVSRTITTTN